MSVALFGKLPAQGDFLRVDASGPAAQALVTWLHEAVEPVHRAGLPLPAEPVRFLVHAAGAGQAVVGTMVASEDRVGRRFPLCVFSPWHSGALAGAFPAVPAAADPFCGAAEGLLARASSIEPAALAEGARTLPACRDLRESEAELARRAAERPLSQLLASAYDGLPEGAPAYGLSTLAAAIRPVRKHEPLKPTLALDGIARDDLERYVWLDLVRRTLGWAAPPSVFWTRDRLIISLGPPPATVLQHLADPARPPARIWPLRSAHPEAIAAAQRGLPPEVRRVLEAPSQAATALLALSGALGGGRG